MRHRHQQGGEGVAKELACGDAAGHEARGEREPAKIKVGKVSRKRVSPKIREHGGPVEDEGTVEATERYCQVERREDGEWPQEAGLPPPGPPAFPPRARP